MAVAAAAAGTDPAAGSDNIRVVLRVRPRNDRELSVGGGMCVQPLGSTAVRVASHPEPHSFSFDYVAGDGTDQETIFHGGLCWRCLGGSHVLGATLRNSARCTAAGCLHLMALASPAILSPCLPAVAGRPIVENCLAGYNGCIFACEWVAGHMLQHISRRLTL